MKRDWLLILTMGLAERNRKLVDTGRWKFVDNSGAGNWPTQFFWWLESVRHNLQNFPKAAFT